MSPRSLLALSPLLFMPFAHAAVDCANASDQATMNQCAGQDFKAADKELNTLYQQITGRLKDNPDGKKLLVSAQRAWLGFRDAECQYQAKSATASYSSAPSDKSMSAAVGAGVGDGIVVAEKQIDLTNDCMRLRGYSGS